MKKFKAEIITGAIAAALIVAAYSGWVWNRSLDSEETVVIIQSGASLGGASRLLEQKKILSNTWSFKLLAYVRGDSRKIKAGEYRIEKNITQHRLLNQLVSGKVIEYPLVVIEGWNFRELRAALEAAPNLEKLLTGKTDSEIMRAIGQDGLHPEGRFYPDTYLYSVGDSDVSILKRAFAKMEQTLKSEWQNRDPEAPLSDPYEALILASIIEKETGQSGERSMISGVFVNRLRKRMRLQTDPTVIYGMGLRYRGNIRLNDLKRDTPYNTYTRGGLPPTPIAMPGVKAIRAALHPSETRALYFVARGDGGHVFSNTLKEHNNAVTKYQIGRNRKKDYRSSPDI